MKSLSKALVIVMVLLMLTACGSGNSQSTQDTSSDNANVSAENKTTEETSTPAESSKKPTLKVLSPYQPTDPNQEPPLAKIEELTGYDLEFFMLPAERADEKLNMEIAGNADYDILMLSPNQYRMLAGKGALTPMNDLIDQLGPNVKAAIKEDEWTSAKVDGQIMGVPTFDAQYIGGGLAYNVNMCKDAGVEMKRDMTISEFYNALKKIQAKYPDKIPMTGSGAWSQGIASAFELSTFDFNSINGKAVHRLLQPNTKDYVTFMNGLYKGKLIDPDWPTNTGEQVNEKFTSGKAVIAWMGWWNATTINEAVKKNTDSDVDYVHPLLSDNGASAFSVRNGVTGFRAIPKYSKKSQDVIKFMNEFADPVKFETIFIGPEGTHHKVVENNGKKEYWPIFPAFTEWFNGHYFTMVAPSDTYTSLWLCRVRKSEELYSAFERMNTYDKKYWVYDALAYAPPMPNISKYSQSANKLENDTIIEFIAGSKPLSEWDSFLEKWHKEGGDAMIADAAEYEKK